MEANLKIPKGELAKGTVQRWIDIAVSLLVNSVAKKAPCIWDGWFEERNNLFVISRGKNNLMTEKQRCHCQEHQTGLMARLRLSQSNTNGY